MKRRKSQEINRSCKKEPSRNYTTGKYSNRNKNSLDGLNSRLERIENRISELEQRPTEFTLSEQRENQQDGRKYLQIFYLIED